MPIAVLPAGQAVMQAVVHGRLAQYQRQRIALAVMVMAVAQMTV